MEPSGTVIECPVCATRIVGLAELCVRCRTPHHQDCARFLGRCAVFGCGAFQFSTGDALSALQTEQVTLDGAPEPVIGAAPHATTGLKRRVWSRIRASARLLWGNPSITVPLLVALVLVDCVLSGILGGPAKLVAQSVLVILFVARAKGKDSNLQSGLGLLWSRGGRILWSLFKATLSYGFLGWVGTLICGVSVAAASAGGAASVLGLLGMLCGACVLLLAVRKYFAYSLVPVVAALGATEEPGSPLARSEELSAVDLKQLIYGPMAILALAAPVVVVAGVVASLFEEPGPARMLITTNPGEWLGMLGFEVLTLVWTMYLILYYLEARKMLQAASLPFAPEEMVPSQAED